ncbi:Uncharacterised protein [Edwardsiella tarda]|nr:Uncharacterised protein [Edwardsiella tarda]
MKIKWVWLTTNETQWLVGKFLSEHTFSKT